MALRTFALAALLFASVCGGARGAQLPARLTPAAPFPRILTQAPTVSFVAPGIWEGDYLLSTPDGPIAVHAVAVDPHLADVRLETVIANDRLVSGAEPVSAMAARTGAVAGINGDYFDIGATNAPTNVVVKDGRLLRTPRKRAAFVLETNGSSLLGELSFAGTVQIGTHSAALTGINELPPPAGGIALITPEFGAIAPSPATTLVALQPLDGTPPFARYRAGSIADSAVSQPAGTYLAIAASAYSPDTLPNPGDVVTASGDLAPPVVSEIADAIGGGPVLLRDGAWYADPDGPNGATFARRIPTSGVAVATDGTIFLIEVDGRQPDVSIGLTRPQFAALMLALGANDGMALDGGGSSTLVARRLGDDGVSVLNSPSDGAERRVGDALLVYSDVAVGPPARAVVAPSTVRALVGSSTPLRTAVIDAAGHHIAVGDDAVLTVVPRDLGTVVNGSFVARRAGRGTLHVAYAVASGTVPIVVDGRPARLDILPSPINLSPGGRIRLIAHAYDADGFPLALPTNERWTASSGTIDADGSFTAATSDATVRVRAGATTATQRITVGQHERSLALSKPPTFATAPRGGPGGLNVGTACPSCLALRYDFSGNERAAYVDVGVPLPAGALGIAFDVDSDGSGALVRVTFANAIDETFLVTATTLNAAGHRHVVARVPNAVGAGARVVSIYVLAGMGGHVIHGAGSVTFSHLNVLLPGSAPPGGAVPGP
ncbi:MAG TPA: phosphodiester glycosidase family protein [Candidatus Baltobacteraceae bacterium]